MLMRNIRAHWENLPIIDLRTLLAGRVPLIIAPHPDDESLGCGGLLAQCAAAGIPAQVAILTDGSHSHPNSINYPPPRLAAIRQQEAIAALALLGLSDSDLCWIGAEDTRLPASGAATEAIVTQLRAYHDKAAFSLVFCAWGLDPHCDHEAAAAIARRLCDQMRFPLLSYPVWGWTLSDESNCPALQDGFRLNVQQELPLKRKAIRAHATQYGGVITDSPNGFTLPENLLAIFERPYETFLLS